ncbi:MAG: hypothetical protein DWG80_02355 [Chloroflexi bacterium]|nr:hypothetical protein [Chloroflexota bacterium]MQC48445.1 hypothetical protein [Chloroflexota bacterium]
MTSGQGRVLEERDNPRFAVIRRAVIYVPAAIVLTGLLVMALLNLPGSIIAVILLSLGALAVNVEAYQSVADLLGSGPVTSAATVERKWKKSRLLFVGRIHYLMVSARPMAVSEGQAETPVPPKARLFEIKAATAELLEPGDEVEVVHWPHTNAVVSMTLVQRAVERSLPRRPLPEAEAE